MLHIHQNGYRLHFHPSNLAEQLWINPKYKQEVHKFFRAYLKPKDKVIDVGANIGTTTLTASLSVGDTGKVWSIEPHPRIYKFLIENLELNRITNVETINIALGNQASEITITNDRRDDMNRVGTGSLSVKMDCLDELIMDSENIALLKVDVEGYEKFVFEGAKKILKNANCIYFEISKTHFSWFEYKIYDLLELLLDKGFYLFRMQENGYLSKIDSKYETDRVEDIIGIKDIEDFLYRTKFVISK